MSDIVNGLTFIVPGSRLKPKRKKLVCSHCDNSIIVGTDSKRTICEGCASNVRHAELKAEVDSLKERISALEAEIATR